MSYMLLIAIVTVGFLLLINVLQLPKKVPEKVNQEHFVEVTPVLNVLHQTNVKDSHWYIKTFLRPRRK